MNICMMTNTYLPHVGGVARSVDTFAEQYRQLGHQVLIVAPTFKGRPPPRRIERHVARVPAIQQFNGSDFSVRLPFSTAFSDRLDGFPADIVHAHHPFLLGDSALRVASVKNVPIIFTHHTRYEDYTHYVPFDSDLLKEMAVRLSTDYANLCDGVIAPSESLAKLIRSRGVTQPIEVVPTGIDVAAFAGADRDRGRRKFKLPADALVLGHVGRLAAEKNLPYLCHAVADVLKQEPQVRFLIIGAGPAEAEIQEIFATAGVSDRVIMGGKQTGAALERAYRAMDVFVFASKSETQGMVVAEAMAAGLPVVAVDASGVREVVRDDYDGRLLAADAPFAEFAQATLQVIRETERRARYAAAARETAAGFSRERCAERALAFYENVRRATRRERLINDVRAWSHLQDRLGMEWELLAHRAQALVESMFGGPAEKRFQPDQPAAEAR